MSVRGRAEVLGVRAGPRGGPIRRAVDRQDPGLPVDPGTLPKLYLISSRAGRFAELPRRESSTSEPSIFGRSEHF